MASRVEIYCCLFPGSQDVARAGHDGKVILERVAPNADGHRELNDDDLASRINSAGHTWAASQYAIDRLEALGICTVQELVAKPRTVSDLLVRLSKTKATIPPEYRTKAMSKRQAAKYLGRPNPDSGVRWLNKCIKDGTIACEFLSRNSHIFDRRESLASTNGPSVISVSPSPWRTTVAVSAKCRPAEKTHAPACLHLGVEPVDVVHDRPEGLGVRRRAVGLDQVEEVLGHLVAPCVEAFTLYTNGQPSDRHRQPKAHAGADRRPPRARSGRRGPRRSRARSPGRARRPARVRDASTR